jgi:hypothetical protein
MHAAGHPCPVLGDPEVGKNEEVKKILADAICKSATQAMDNCEDLHTAVDNFITEVESQSM